MAEKRGTPNRKASRSSDKTSAKVLSQDRAAVTTQRGPKPSDLEQPDPNVKQSRKFNLKALLLDWRFVTIAGLILTTSLTTLSIAFILKLPAIPNCPAIFWPLATASMRLHCAQIAASKRTVNDLIEAIELVSGLPKDHPLYEEASRWIEEWSTELLNLAQEKFNTGKLDEAIAAAKKIPAHAAAAQQVEERITHWKKIWAEAEAVISQVEKFLAKRNWRDAFNEATKLLAIDNPYWQTKRYSEISEIISTAKDEITKLGAADRAIEEGGPDELLKAYKDLETIPEKSALYQEVKDLKPRIGQRMMKLTENAADRGAFDEALSIANKIPDGIKVKQDMDDFIALVSAQSKAKKGELIDIEDAISQAERIPVGRPLHARAQMLAARWKAEVRDIAQLNRAKDLARTGSLQAALNEASNISSGNPKFREARDFISQNSAKIQTNQDQTTLDQAIAMAASGDGASLQTAIDIARQISSNSSLYNQAQAQIKSWTASLKRLDNPAPLTNSPTNTPNSNTTEPLTADQSLLTQANALAQSNGGRPEDLLQAIAIAQQISGSSRSQAKQAIDQWSDQLLQAAIGQNAYDAVGAIDLAARIPAGTAAYSQAQTNIALWKKQLGQR
jgi:hypothetical protein